MILTKEVEINLKPQTIIWFENKGYIIPKYKDNHNRLRVKRGTKIIVKIKDLPKGSTAKVLCKCDICGKERLLKYVDYHSICKKCINSQIGINSNHWQGGKPKCIKCGKTLSVYTAKLCKHCFENRIEKNKCIDCSTEISPKSTRCYPCWCKYNSGSNHYNWNPNKTEFEKYRVKVNTLTRRYKKELFKNWNGLDYYTGKNISKLSKQNITIDHKISVYYGFLNNISPEDICKLENLCITDRKINSSKWKSNEQEYKSLNNI